MSIRYRLPSKVRRGNDPKNINSPHGKYHMLRMSLRGMGTLRSIATRNALWMLLGGVWVHCKVFGLAHSQMYARHPPNYLGRGNTLRP